MWMDPDRFQRICEEYREFGPEEPSGIGTLSEKSLHAVLKRYYQPAEAYREIRVGRYVADVVTQDGCILEIQTRSLSAIKKKLSVFLEQYEVILVHPVPHLRWMRTVEGKNGLTGPRRRCGREGCVWDAFRELSFLHEYLSCPNLHIVLPLVDLEELRLEGTRRNARVDRIPMKLFDEIRLFTREDYWALLPEGLPENFSSRDMSHLLGISPDAARLALYVMFHAGALLRIGKEGNRILYHKTQEL